MKEVDACDEYFISICVDCILSTSLVLWWITLLNNFFRKHGYHRLESGNYYLEWTESRYVTNAKKPTKENISRVKVNYVDFSV